MNEFKIRFATEHDVTLILSFIRELAAYELMSNQVVATEESLHKWLFTMKKAEVLIGEVAGVAIGFALFFPNFSTFVGKPGLYLEDLYIQPKYRNQGYGKKFFQRLAEIAIQRDYGRFEWACLDWNEPSIHFYQSLGAKPLNDWTIYRLDIAGMKKLTQD